MKPRVLLLGSTGRWPVVRGSLARTACANTRVYVVWHSASGRMLQAGSLCSPEKKFAPSSLTHCLRRLSYISSVRSVAIFILHVFEVGSEIKGFG